MKFKTRSKTNRILVYLCEFTDDAGLADLEKIHRSRGALQCGYHYVVRKDGTVEQGRPDNTIGWHHPRRNEDSVAVAFVVDPGQQYNEAQADSGILTALLVKYPGATIECEESPR